jgi:hypothetical protein
MRVEYRLDVVPPLPVQAAVKPIIVDDISVSWEISEGKLTAICFTLCGGRLRRDRVSDSILTDFPELEPRAFQIASYVANRIFIQTTFDAIDPYVVVGKWHSEIEPETPAEQQEFERNPTRQIGKSLGLRFHVRGTFDPTSYTDRPEHWSALANFSDALRVRSPFLKFEQLYKVVEHFAGKDSRGETKQGQDFDQAIFNHVINLDSSFSENEIKDLRELRIRSTHPENRKGSHLNPQNIEDVRTIDQSLPRLKRLAELLLDNPYKW